MTASVLKNLTAILFGGCVYLYGAAVARAQAEFAIKAVTSHVDSGIMLTWDSEPGALYEIQFSETLETNSWKTLYPDMPSMGTSTFYTDAGDFAASPEVLRPELVPRRFYRVVKTSQNQGVGATLVLTGITPGAELSNIVTVTVAASGQNGLSEIRLFIDGAEYDRRGDNPSQFTINTCEWRNGTHKISAVAVDSAGVEFQTTPAVGDSNPNYSATPGIDVNFQNYVSHFKFSEDLFEPESGETQIISARFTQNSTWALKIRDVSGILVRSANGIGQTMNFSWDGKGEGGAALAQGSFDFSVIAQAVAAGAGPVVLAPPAQGGAATSPQRLARKIKGVPGTLGIAWQGHHPAPQIATFLRPLSGFPGQNRVTLVPNYQLPYGKIRNAGAVARGFASEMKKGGWKTGFELGDDALGAGALRKPAKGGTSKFNSVNIGLLVGHGIHGESIDNVATNTGAFQTYFPIYKTGNTNYDWARLSECEFGSANLRWMAIYSCNMLHEVSYDSMFAKGVLPINDKLHLLLGSKTSVFMYPSFGQKWASYMLGREGGGARTVMEAWFAAGALIHDAVKPAIPVQLRVVGWPDCFSDTLSSFTETTTDNIYDIEFRDRTVWTP